MTEGRENTTSKGGRLESDLRCVEAVEDGLQLAAGMNQIGRLGVFRGLLLPFGRQQGLMPFVRSRGPHEISVPGFVGFTLEVG